MFGQALIHSFIRALRNHPYIMSVKRLSEWVYKMTSFADVQYFIYADIVGGWIKKSTKLC